MLSAQMLHVFWLCLKLFAMYLTVPHTDVLVFVVEPLLPRAVDPVGILAERVCAVIGLQVVDQVHSATPASVWVFRYLEGKRKNKTHRQASLDRYLWGH